MRIVCLLSLSLFLFACNQASTSPDTKVSVNSVSTDSLLNHWNTAWNNRDSAAIASQFSDDAVFLSGKKPMSGKEEILNKFVGPNHKLLLNLQTQKVYETVAGDVAICAGTYSHGVVGKDTVLQNLTGSFIFVWKQQTDKSWKLQFSEIE